MSPRAGTDFAKSFSYETEDQEPRLSRGFRGARLLNLLGQFVSGCARFSAADSVFCRRRVGSGQADDGRVREACQELRQVTGTD